MKTTFYRRVTNLFCAFTNTLKSIEIESQRMYLKTSSNFNMFTCKHINKEKSVCENDRKQSEKYSHSKTKSSEQKNLSSLELEFRVSQ